MCLFPQNGRSVTLTWVFIVSPIELNSGNWRSDCFKKWIYHILNFRLIWRASFSVCLSRSQPVLSLRWTCHGQTDDLLWLQLCSHAVRQRVKHPQCPLVLDTSDHIEPHLTSPYAQQQRDLVLVPSAVLVFYLQSNGTDLVLFHAAHHEQVTPCNYIDWC